MENKKLGCLTRGGLISIMISVILLGLSFALSGFSMFSPGDLSNRSSGKALGDVTSHSELVSDCKSCHPAPWSVRNQADRCLDCHQDITQQLQDLTSLHGAAMSILTSHDCRGCHSEHLGAQANITNFSGENFPHNLVRFSLLSHQDPALEPALSCQDCHPGSYRGFESSICSTCHLDTGKRSFEIHLSDFGEDCLACHDGVETINMSFSHLGTRFLLTGKHLLANCASCHAGETDLGQFANTSSDCLDCHLDDDAHHSNLGVKCGDCHTASSWKPALYDHQSTGFILDGGHAELSCRDCHLDPTFQGAESDCQSCHLDDEPHQGLFGAECSLCHTTSNWLDIQFDHSGSYTSFCDACHQEDSPANHYQGQCSACHLVSGWLPATFDHRVAQATDCQNCHLPDVPQNHFGGQCSLCHSIFQWKPATINHTFPTNHEGAQNRCPLCHVNNNYYGYNCYQCHEHNRTEVKKEHEGISNLDNCIRCHWDGRKHESGDD